MNDKQEKISTLLTAMMPKETLLATSLKGLSLFRIDDSFSRTPYSYNSEIIIMGQGEKHTYIGNEVYTYDASRYLVLPVPLPLECKGISKPGKPILGLSIAIDPIEVGEILLNMGDGQKEIQSLPRGIFGAPMNEALYDATIRLLQAIANPLDNKVLAPSIKREIIYRVLRGANGEILQALVHRNKRFFQIAKVMQKIHESCSVDFDLEKLAHDLDMSSSTFHSSFKAITETSPLQYIKNVRLHTARTLMIKDGLNVNVAAFQVGYESSSQFNREYKRLFGITPAKDVTVLRGNQERS